MDSLQSLTTNGTALTRPAWSSTNFPHCSTFANQMQAPTGGFEGRLAEHSSATMAAYGFALAQSRKDANGQSVIARRGSGC